MSAEERGAFSQRLASFGNPVRGELPGMRDNRPDFQLDGNASGASTFGEARGVIAQDFVRAHVNEKRRKAGEIGVERGGQRGAGIGVAEVVACGSRDVPPAKHGAAVGGGSNGGTGGGKIGPGGKKRRGRRKRND